jgi:hypothetical protein
MFTQMQANCKTNLLDIRSHINELNFFVPKSTSFRQRLNVSLYSRTKIFVMSAVLIVAAFLATSVDQKIQAQEQRDVNWQQLCTQYGVLVGIHTPCSELAHGTVLTDKGRTGLMCLLGGGILSLVVDPVTLAAIAKAGQGFCP